MAGSTKHFRRTALTAAVVGAAVVTTAIVGPGLSPALAGTPATVATAGQATAIAQSYRVNPTTASLSIGITFGLSLAGYTNNVAQAESRAIDLGIVGSTLAAESCSGGDPTLPADQQPQSLTADSRDPDAGQQKTEAEKYAPFITKSVRADSSPNGVAETTTAGINAAGAEIGLNAAHSQAITRLKAGNREALATADVGSFGIPGVVELAGLHWSALSSSGAVDATTGSFSIGALKVLGQALPVTDSAAAVENANVLLAPLGIRLSYPKVHVSAGFLFVDPLTVSIIPSKTRDSIAQLVIGNIQPVRENIYDVLLKQDCGNKSYILVSDIALGSVTGAGSLSVELGGVQTKSDALKTSSFLGLTPLGSPSSGLGDGGSSFDSGGSSFDALPSGTDLGSSNITGGTTTAAPGTTASKPAALAAAVKKGSRGGRMAIVGALGLLALLLVADRDRRLMRRAQRTIPTEA